MVNKDGYKEEQQLAKCYIILPLFTLTKPFPCFVS